MSKDHREIENTVKEVKTAFMIGAAELVLTAKSKNVEYYVQILHPTYDKLLDLEQLLNEQKKREQ